MLPAAFLLVALLFACLGRPIGLLLTEVRPPLRAYGLDVAGSLAGIAAFFCLSLTERPPAVWFGGLTVALLVLAGFRLRNLLLTLAPMAAVIVIATAIGGRELVVALLPGGPDGHAGAPQRLGADREQHRPPDHADGRRRRSPSTACRTRSSATAPSSGP